MKVYDYVDHREKFFNTMFEKRKKGYKALGYTIETSDPNRKKDTQQMELF